MPRTSGILDSLSGGVSTRPQSQRAPGEADEQVNVLSLYKRALSRRPPMEHVAKLLTDTTGWETAFAHEIRRSDTERYIVLLINGTLHVFNEADGTEIPVETQHGFGYLAGATSGYRAVTVGDETILLNRSTVIKKGTSTTTIPPISALLAVRQGDFSTTYAITLNGQKVSYTTPSSGRNTIATDEIAGQLVLALQANSFTNSNFTFTQFGSTIYVVPNSGKDFSIYATDGLGDNALIPIKGSVQRFTDLPPVAVEGFVVEVQGDPTTDQGAYWMQYSAAANPQLRGVWKECAKPGSLTALDGSTMPHHLVYCGSFMPITAAQGPPLIPTVSTGSFASSELITFPTAFYPAGATITISESGNDFVYVVGGVGETASAVAAAMLALINADPTYSSGNLVGNHFDFARTDTVFPGVSITMVYDPAKKFFNKDLVLPVNAYTGFTIKNLTDGSSSVIDSNGVNSVTLVIPLSGGATNQFNAGDLCEIVDSGIYFLFDPAPWAARSVGEDASAPFPSFIGKAVSDVFMHQGRLGLLSSASVVLSRAGDTYNLFRQSAYQLLPDDPVDVASSILSAPNFHSSANWNDALYIFSDLGPFKLSGNPVISPTTVTLTLTSEYKSDPQVHPLVLGNSMFFSAVRSGVPILWEMRVRGVELARLAIAEEVTKPVEGYIEGTALQMTADDTQGVLVYRTTQRDSLYVYVCQYEGMSKIQSSWSRWELTGNSQAVWAIARRGEVLLITQQSDGLYLNSLILDTSENPAARLTPRTAWWWGDGTMVFDGSKVFF